MRLKIIKQFRLQIGKVRWYLYKDDVLFGGFGTEEEANKAFDRVRDGDDKETIVREGEFHTEKAYDPSDDEPLQWTEDELKRINELKSTVVLDRIGVGVSSDTPRTDPERLEKMSKEGDL